jgi:protein-S-isoprenylcysteine O-methyltransferase Ste14
MIGLAGPLESALDLIRSTRSVVFLMKYLVWETVHHNAFVSKIGSESRSRRFSGRKHRPAARLEWFPRNLKFRCGTLRYPGETGVRTLVFLQDPTCDRGLFDGLLVDAFGSADSGLWTQPPLAAGTGLAFTVAGLCFAVWARIHLGKYWSGRITLKENHRVIQTGPYAWVRHPIYSGLILALFGTAITLGTISAFAGFAFMLISFVRKLKIEETWLRSQFGAEYEAYQNRVKALIPRL